MNRILTFLIVGIVIIVSSCNSIDEPIDISPLYNSEDIYKVSVEEAEETVVDFLSKMETSEELVSRSGGEPRKISDIQVIRNTSVISRSSNIAGIDTLMYIVNFKNDAGFAVVGADKRTEPIFAIIDHGNYDINTLETEENEGFITFLNLAIATELEDIKGSQKNNLSRATSNGWNIVSKINPIIKTKWSQGGVNNPNSFGKYCPNKVTGCTVTATAQILSHFQTIGRIQWSNNGTSGSAILNWSRIMADCERTGGYLSPSTTPQSIDEIAHLCRYLGVAFNANYKIDKKHPEKNSTGVGEDKPIDWFNKWGGLKATKLAKYDENRIISAIQSGNPVYGRGNSGKRKFLGIRVSWKGGHAWIYDGYIYATKDNNPQKLIHCNWGWGGSCNGFYLSKVFNTNLEPEIKDYEISRSGESGNYRYNLEYSIINK